jgi:hypothetical protein
MWKVILGFVVFAAIAMFVVMKGGDKLDMGGEKHEGAPEQVPAAASAPASAASN